MRHEVRLLCGWLTRLEVAYEDVVYMHAQRAVWRSISEMLEANADIPNRYFIGGLLRQWYLSYQLSGLRRHSDFGPRTASLARIWQSIARHPTILTKERYVALSSKDDFGASLSSRLFNDRYGPGLDHVDPAIAEQHADDLRAGLSRVRNHVNAQIAHLNANPQDHSLTDKDVDDGLALIEDSLKALYLLLTGGSLAGAEPVFQTPWQSAFTVRWINDDWTLPPPAWRDDPAT